MDTSRARKKFERGVSLATSTFPSCSRYAVDQKNRGIRKRNTYVCTRLKGKRARRRIVGRARRIVSSDYAPGVRQKHVQRLYPWSSPSRRIGPSSRYGFEEYSRRERCPSEDILRSICSFRFETPIEISSARKATASAHSTFVTSAFRSFSEKFRPTARSVVRLICQFHRTIARVRIDFRS